MNDKIKEIFDRMHAEEQLKNHTKAFLAQKTNGYTGRKAAVHQFRYSIVACACILFTLLGTHRLYFTRTAEISLEINPAIALGVNRFDRIISVKGLNRDGRELAESLDIKYVNYADAIEQVISDENIETLLAENEIMTITVAGNNDTQSSKLLSGIETCTAGQKNTCCYFASSEEAKAARELGLPCGKYKAYLELLMLDPDISPETVRNMTIRQIRDRIDSLSTDYGDETGTEDRRGGNCGAGKGDRNGRGNCKAGRGNCEAGNGRKGQ